MDVCRGYNGWWKRNTHGLAADVRMPDPCHELHDRRPERILSGNTDINAVDATFVWRIGWTWEGGFQMCDVVAGGVGGRGVNVRLSVLLDVGELFAYAAHAVGGHGVGV